MQRWLITGGSGLLGHALAEYLLSKQKNLVSLYNSRHCKFHQVQNVQKNLFDYEGLEKLILQFRPDVIVHAAALTNVDECENQVSVAYKLHSEVTAKLAALSANIGIKFVFISTDQLWDGKSKFYSEDTDTSSINVYAKSKRSGEIAALKVNPNSLILRTNFFGFGLPWRDSIFSWMVRKFLNGEQLVAFTNAFFTPISLPLFVKDLIKLVEKEAVGIFHVAGSERITKFDFAVRIASDFNLDSSLIKPLEMKEFGLIASRPVDMSLSSSKISKLLGSDRPDLSQSFEALQLKDITDINQIMY
jgi:dTDP-4-dehydrorhamnose reductase